MKKAFTLLLLASSFFIYSQEDKTDVEYFENLETKITSLKYSSNSITELENIDWKDVKSIFESNKEDEIVKFIFEIDLKQSKNKFKGSTTVSGKTKNIDSLIIKAKKVLKSLIKISRKYEN